LLFLLLLEGMVCERYPWRCKRDLVVDDDKIHLPALRPPTYTRLQRLLWPPSRINPLSSTCVTVRARSPCAVRHISTSSVSQEDCSRAQRAGIRCWFLPNTRQDCPWPTTVVTPPQRQANDKSSVRSQPIAA